MDKTALEKAMQTVYNVIPEFNETYVKPPFDFLVRVALLLGSEEALWGSMQTGDDEAIVEAVVFSETRVVHALRADDQLSVRAFRRNDLTDLAIDGVGAEEFRNDWVTTWPGSPRLTATYRNGAVLRLPMFRGTLTQPIRRHFDSFFPQLVQDLTPGRDHDTTTE
ncbi:hypothetical protein [Dactylosporangium sp. NPDC051541]|uniref:hypothetical protein n=1 Tax=Dactylosporangium sp. NPDC051541 TaxID=3363977 RepID=UPI0037A9C5F2